MMTIIEGAQTALLEVLYGTGKALISTSGVGTYGDTRTKVVDETDPLDPSLMMGEGDNEIATVHVKDLADLYVLALMSALELARELEGGGVKVNIDDPGGANTESSRRGSKWMVWGMSLLRLTPKQAARSSAYLATSKEAAHLNGAYITPKLKLGKASCVAFNEDLAKRARGLSLGVLERHQSIQPKKARLVEK